MRPLYLLLSLVCVAVTAAEPSCMEGGACEHTDEEGAEKYSRERNKPEGIVDQMALLKNALLDLVKDPYNPDVLRSSLAELALFAETKEGQKFLEQFTAVMDGKGGGATGALVRQMFTSVLAGRVDVGSLMTEGISAGSLANLAGGILGKNAGKEGNGMKTEDLLPILHRFLNIIKEEQASPFLLDRLNEAFTETMSESQLRKFERTAAGVLGGIKAARGEDDSHFEYDQSALETFESYMQDFVEEQEWDWSRNGATLMKEVKKVMRIFTGAEDQIGRLLPSLMEVIAEAKPTAAERVEIIDNFGGILGNVVKKDSAEPEFVHVLLEKLKMPLKDAKAEAEKLGLKTKDDWPETSKKEKDVKEDDFEEEIVVDEEEEIVDEKTNIAQEEEDTQASGTDSADKSAGLPSMDEVDSALKKAEGAFANVPDISKLADSIATIANDPAAMQDIMLKVASSGGNLNMQTIAEMVPQLEGLDQVTNYLTNMQESADEKEIAAHFHEVMDAVGDAFDLLKSDDVRRTALEQALPYIHYAHDFLKEPMALLKIQMGVASLSNMYGTSVSDIIDMAAPYVEDFVTPLGIQLNFIDFCNDAHKFMLKVYKEVYESKKSIFKTLRGHKEDEYIVSTLDHSLGEPLMEAYSAYTRVRRQPECLLQALCVANRRVAQSDAGAYGVRTTFMEGAR